MNKFKIIRPEKASTKSQFNFLMDDDLQLWIRQLAAENAMPIADVMHQALSFARDHYCRR